jgi:inorganic triphosphatase YgiF
MSRVPEMSPPREIELKLDVPIGNLPRLIASPLLKGASAFARKPASLVSVYFDTDKLKLRQRGLSLRLRQMGRGHIRQTVKQEHNGNAALFARSEWEHDICTNQPDLDAARETGLAPLLNKKLRRNLRPVFETRVHRKVFQIHSGNSDIELSIDKGTVEAGRESTPLCEVEVELKQGQASDLFKLAKMLAQEIPVQLAVKSKADRGYALLTAEKIEPVKAAPVTLAPDADLQSAFQIIARACLHQLVANQSLMLAGDAEALHQMRVALRRLRAAISLFSGILADSQTNFLKAEFKWITGELGPAREFEIFLKRVVKPAADREHDEPGIALVSQELRHRRERALAQARAAVDGQRFRDLALDTAAWIETGDWTRNADHAAGMPRERPVAAVARVELRRRWKKILKLGKRLDELDAERRHRLRIQTKKLRYATEFFSTLFPGNKSTRRRKRLVARLEQLQDALGDLNDIAVNGKLSEQLLDSEETAGKRRSGRTKKAFAVGRLSGREEALIAPVLKQAQEAYAALTKSKPFWD